MVLKPFVNYPPHPVDIILDDVGSQELALIKRYMRFGRSGKPLSPANGVRSLLNNYESTEDAGGVYDDDNDDGYYYQLPEVDDVMKGADDKRYMRFGKRYMRFGKRYMRFGRRR